MAYYPPEVAWTTIIENVVLVDSTKYNVTVVPNNINEPGAMTGEKSIGYYLKDNVGHTYSIVGINIDGNSDRIQINDDFNEGVGPQSGQFAYIYKSVGDGKAPYLAPIRHVRLDKSALDYSRAIELDVIWKNKEPIILDKTNGYLCWDFNNNKWIFKDDVYSTSVHKHYQLYQPDNTNPFVYTDNGGVLHIDGNIVQNGSIYETHAEQLYTKNDKIIFRDGAISGLSTGEYVGIVAKLYDGVNDGQLVFDNKGIARVGDVGYEQPLATRIESPTNGQFAYWDGSYLRLNFKSLTTSDVSEGTRLYYTDDRTKSTIASVGSGFVKSNGSVLSIDGNTYLTSSALNDYVTLSTNQNILGVKTFENGMSIYNGLNMQTSNIIGVGSVQATKFIMNGYNSDYVLRADGGTVLISGIGNGVYAPVSGSTNYIQNQNSLAQSANMWIGGNAIFGWGNTKTASFDYDGTGVYNAGIGLGSDTRSLNIFSIMAEGNSGFNFIAGTKSSHSTVASISQTGIITALNGNSTQWNSAYGWGNHAGLYLPLTGGTLTGNLTGTGFNFSFLKESGGITFWGGANQGGLTWDTGYAKVFSTGTNDLRLESGSGTIRIQNNTDITGNLTATGSATFGGSVTATGSGTFQGGGFDSLRSIKNVHGLWTGNALEGIRELVIEDFNYKHSLNHSRTAGFIIDEVEGKSLADFLLFGEKRQSINIYSAIGLSFKAHQETYDEITTLKHRIEYLENELKQYRI